MFVTLSGFWPLRVLGESIKKGKFVIKIFFQIMLNEVFISGDVKADVKEHETKELLAVSCNFS